MLPLREWGDCHRTLSGLALISQSIQILQFFLHIYEVLLLSVVAMLVVLS